MSKFKAPWISRTHFPFYFGFSALLVALVSAVVLSGARAATAPYAENFDSYANGSSPNNFVTNSGGLIFGSTWQVDNPNGAGGSYHNGLAGDNAHASAAISITNLVQIDFTLSTTFVLSPPYFGTAGLYNCQVGLGALSGTGDFSGSGYQLAYEAFSSGPNYARPASLTLYRGNSIVGGSDFFAQIPVVVGQIYTMTLSGAYSPAGLVLMGMVTDGTSALSFSTLDANPASGTYFGFYDTAQGLINHGVQIGVNYDNFSISVPEPGVTVLLAAGLMFFGLSARLRALRSKQLHRFIHATISSALAWSGLR